MNSTILIIAMQNMLIFPIRTTFVIITKIVNIPYSLRKRRMNTELPISTLNPLISSLSPSRRSKGARLLSISEMTNHITPHKKKISVLLELVLKKNLFEKLNANKKIIMRAASKESLWSSPRTDPSLEKSLVTLHPDIITP